MKSRHLQSLTASISDGQQLKREQGRGESVEDHGYGQLQTMGSDGKQNNHLSEMKIEGKLSNK